MATMAEQLKPEPSQLLADVRELLANMVKVLRRCLAVPRPDGQQEIPERVQSKVQELAALGFTAAFPQEWPQDPLSRVKKYLTEIRPLLMEMAEEVNARRKESRDYPGEVEEMSSLWDRYYYPLVVKSSHREQ